MLTDVKRLFLTRLGAFCHQGIQRSGDYFRSGGYRGQVTTALPVMSTLTISLELGCSLRVIGSQVSLVRYHLKDVAVKTKR